jgi:polar amino acid transport system substrate-binding protein
MRNYFSVTQSQSPPLVEPNPFISLLNLAITAIQNINLPLILVTYFSLIMFTQAEIQHEKLMVSYESHGKQHTIKGIKTPKGYRFNEDSNKVINLATLNWPPHISEELCNNGWVFQFTVALLVSRDYQVNINFYPWSKSVMLVEQGQMDILFPTYFIESSAPSDAQIGRNRRELLVLSNKFSAGELSLLKRTGDSFNLQGNLANLKDKVIGVVQGYQNTPEFDAMMDSKQFETVEAVDELQLVKLLVAKKVDLIIGDPRVFTFSVNYSNLSNSNKQALLDRIERVEPTLQGNHLYFAISNQYQQWRQLLDDMNLAILAFQQSGETERFIKIGSGCTLDL